MLGAARDAGATVGGDPGALRRLLDGLIESGLNIARFGNSRPASGLEHHCSHFWDLLASRGLHEHSSHGLQVGYATGFGMRLQRYAFAGGVSTLRPPRASADPLGAEAQHWLGEPTADLLAAVAAKQQMTAQIPPRWPTDAAAWSEVREALAVAMEPFDDVERGLAQARIPTLPGFLGIDREVLVASFHHATRLRDRYTTIDFLEGQGQLDAAIVAALG
jgi:glycerol-1-phosphate dehydrogenase [NAD(P)+]